MNLGSFKRRLLQKISALEGARSIIEQRLPTIMSAVSAGALQRQGQTPGGNIFSSVHHLAHA